jgi:hypothetical protein
LSIRQSSARRLLLCLILNLSQVRYDRIFRIDLQRACLCQLVAFQVVAGLDACHERGGLALRLAEGLLDGSSIILNDDPSDRHSE